MAKINFWLARSDDMIRSASRLVRKEYVKDGYIGDEEEKESSLSFYAFLPTSSVFSAKIQKAVIGTVTVVGDSGKGLPMDMIYKEETDALRKTGKRLAEISQLAIDRDFVEKFGPKERKRVQSSILISLFRLVFFSALFGNIDTLLIAVNPKHDGFYSMLGFREAGSLKYYKSVNNAPALAKALDINRDYRKIAENNLILREIVKKPLSEDDFEGKNDRVIFSVNPQ